MRSDTLLVTGLTSNERLETNALKRKQRLEEKQTKKTILLPVAKLIMEALETEKTRANQEMLDKITLDTSDEQLKETIVALKLYSTSLSRLEAQFNAILRTPEVRSGK